MCIYLGEQAGLTYHKREHIFPAAIGGIHMLEKGWVSDQANEFFSPLELHVFRKSFVNFVKAYEGPGERGYTGENPKKTPKTGISLGTDEKGEWFLGYVSYGKPYCIMQLHRKGEGSYKVFYSREAGNEFDFIKAMRAFNGKFVTIISKEFPKDEFIIGFHDKKYFVAASERNISMEQIQTELTAFLSAFDGEKKVTIKSGEENSQVELQLQMEETYSEERVFAKIALNVLANHKGKEYVEDSRFDEIKSFILGENLDNREMHLPKINLEKNIFPEKSHWCVFLQEDGRLLAIVCLYNMISHCIDLGVATDDLGKGTWPDGMICDWRNKKEYTFMEWMVEMAKYIAGDGEI